MDEVNQEGTSLNEHSAADLLAGMIDETGLIKQPENDPEEQQEESTETAEGGEQAEEKQEAGDGQSEQPEQPQTVKVKVNGVEMEVPLAEVIAGYQKDADYRQKTAELAEQRRATEAERQAVAQERVQLGEQLNQANALLTAQLQQYQSVDWSALLEQDPQTYLRARHEYDIVLANLQMVQQQRGQLAELQQRESEQERQAVLNRELEALQKAFPHWQDRAVAKQESAAIRDYMLRSGFRPEEVEAATDHRAFVLADKARRYDELMSKGAEAVKKVKSTPARVEKPGGNAEPPNKRATETLTKARRSGRVDDAAEALLASGIFR